MMGRDSCAPEQGFPERRAPTAVRRPGPSTESLIVGAAETDDAEQGYPWRWEVTYGDARRSGACQTRTEAEREPATVLVLLRER